jgi:hypothetical protein
MIRHRRRLRVQPARALDRLFAAGAVRGPIPGGRPPYFEGQELFVPATLFPLFNELLKGGEIYVVEL